MTNTPHHMARMSDDSPRGYGVRGDVRKRNEPNALSIAERVKNLADEWQQSSADNYELHGVPALMNRGAAAGRLRAILAGDAS